MPWQQDDVKGNTPDEHSKYGYHPGGDPSKGVKDAPSALHTTIIPNVTLSRVCATQNSPGAIHTDLETDRLITNNSISMARTTGEEKSRFRWGIEKSGRRTAGI